MKASECFSELYATRSCGHPAQTGAAPIDVAVRQHQTGRVSLLFEGDGTGYGQIFPCHEDNFILPCSVRKKRIREKKNLASNDLKRPISRISNILEIGKNK